MGVEHIERGVDLRLKTYRLEIYACYGFERVKITVKNNL
jgi:hypothetical protein